VRFEVVELKAARQWIVVDTKHASGYRIVMSKHSGERPALKSAKELNDADSNEDHA
jgi:hypothetical protein